MTKLSQTKDTDLVLALNRGDEIAFNELFDRYATRLFRFSFSYLHHEHIAEEIVQEVFLKVWKDRDLLDSDKSFQSFIFTIARNAILNTLRKEKYEQVYAHYAMLNPGKSVLLDDELDFKELERAYLQTVELLSPRRKEIYKLRKFQHLSNEEVAAQLGISVKTVENQMTAALSEIRKSLQHLGFSAIIFGELFL